VAHNFSTTFSNALLCVRLFHQNFIIIE